MIYDNILPLTMKKSEKDSLLQASALSSNIPQAQIKIHCNIQHWASSLGNTDFEIAIYHQRLKPNSLNLFFL